MPGALISIGILAILFAGYCFAAYLLAQSRHDRGDDIAHGDCPHVPSEMTPFHTATYSTGEQQDVA